MNIVVSQKTRELLLEALAIIFSILIAFSIDAWWQGKVEQRETDLLLRSLLAELVENNSLMEFRNEYHEHIGNAGRIILLEFATDNTVLSADSLAHLLGDLSHIGIGSLKRGALDALFSGGNLHRIGNPDLHTTITELNRRFGQFAKIMAQDGEFQEAVWNPYFRENGDLVALWNGIEHLPGLDRMLDNNSMPQQGEVDFRYLFNDPEFKNVVAHKVSVQDGILLEYERLEADMVEAIDALNSVLN